MDENFDTFLSIYQAVICLKRGKQDKACIHTRMHTYTPLTWPQGPHRRRDVHSAQTLHVRSVKQMEQSPKVYPCRFIFNSCPLASCIRYDPRVTPDARELPPGVVEATSLIMHSPLLSIHFYHAQSSFLAPQTFLFHSTLFTPSIHSVLALPLNLTPLTSDPNIFFTSKSSSILSMCPNHHNTYCSAQPAYSRNTSSPSHLFSHLVHMRFSTHTPQHLISIT